MRRKALNLIMAIILAIPIVPLIATQQAQARCYEGDFGGIIGGCGGSRFYRQDHGGSAYRGWGAVPSPRYRHDDRPRFRDYDRRPRHDEFRFEFRQRG